MLKRQGNSGFRAWPIWSTVTLLPAARCSAPLDSSRRLLRHFAPCWSRRGPRRRSVRSRRSMRANSCPPLLWPAAILRWPPNWMGCRCLIESSPPLPRSPRPLLWPLPPNHRPTCSWRMPWPYTNLEKTSNSNIFYGRSSAIIRCMKKVTRPSFATTPTVRAASSARPRPATRPAPPGPGRAGRTSGPRQGRPSRSARRSETEPCRRPPAAHGRRTPPRA